MTKIYISGPITGTTDYKERFREAAEAVKKKGFEAINPVELQSILSEKTTTHAQYMSAALGLLYACEAVLFLPGWQNSKGAVKEHTAARTCGLLRFYDLTEIPQKPLELCPFDDEEAPRLEEGWNRGTVPDDERPVLAYIKAHGVFETYALAAYIADEYGERWIYYGSFYDGEGTEVIAWAELPKPPAS